MNREIEDMAKTLCGQKEHSCAECDSCDLCEFWLEASILCANSYRKSTDVAVGLLECVEKIILQGISKCEHFREQLHTDTDRSYFEGGANSQRQLLWSIRQLRKKYESEEAE